MLDIDENHVVLYFIYGYNYAVCKKLFLIDESISIWCIIIELLLVVVVVV